MTELRPNNPPTKEAELPDKPNLYEGLAKTDPHSLPNC